MRKITQCLNPALTSICKRAIELESITAILHQYLPEHYRAYCKVSSFNKGCLVLLVSNALWASEIRYLLPELRDQLRSSAGLYQLITMKITVC
jgi:hypothetical protein